MNKNKTLIIVLIFCAVFAFAFIYLPGMINDWITDGDVDEKTEEITESDIVRRLKMDKAEWKVFENQVGGYKLFYPPDFELHASKANPENVFFLKGEGLRLEIIRWEEDEDKDLAEIVGDQNFLLNRELVRIISEKGRDGLNIVKQRNRSGENWEYIAYIQKDKTIWRVTLRTKDMNTLDNSADGFHNVVDFFELL